MAGEFKGLTVKFRGDATDLTAALHTINTETSAAKRNARDFQKALKFDSTNVDAIKGAVSETAEQLRAANERADALRQALEETDDPNTHRRLQAALEVTETDVKRLHAEVLELNASLAVQITPMGKLATGLQEAGVPPAGRGRWHVKRGRHAHDSRERPNDRGCDCLGQCGR